MLVPVQLAIDGNPKEFEMGNLLYWFSGYMQRKCDTCHLAILLPVENHEFGLEDI
jgi:hypothetical protein